MYLRKELMINATTNNLDVARFKFIHEPDFSAFTHIEGKIKQVGIDYVDLLLDNNKVVTIMTDRVSRIHWIDPKCERVCKKCHHHTCRCVEFKRDHDYFNHDRFCKKMRKGSKRDHNRFEHDTHREKRFNGFKRDDDKQSNFLNPTIFNGKNNDRHKDKHCERCGNHHDHHEDCFPRFTCYCDFAIPFCDDRIELRLAGLDEGVNLQLFRHKGCRVKLELEFGE